MTDRWTDRLSEYLDGELNETEQIELEEHLRICDQCVATLHDLRGVVTRAQALEDRPPSANLWGGIASRIGAARATGGGEVIDLRSRRRLSLSVPQLLAAGIALMMLSGGAVWMAARGGPAAGGSPVVAVPAGGSTVAARPVVETAQYDETVAELEHLLEEHRGQLDPSTVEALQQSLAVIDEAIADARSALASDPANAYLNNHLADTMRRKLHLLSQAATLARAAT
jgi:anti-sigma factor ChrR (cupin superfamily)